MAVAKSDHHEEVLDATGVPLGRLASRIAVLLQGKHQAAYEPSQGSVTRVVVKNVRAVRLSGKKASAKLIHRFSGYPGGLRSVTLGQALEVAPRRVLAESVRRMLPKNRRAREMLKYLTIEE